MTTSRIGILGGILALGVSASLLSSCRSENGAPKASDSSNTTSSTHTIPPPPLPNVDYIGANSVRQEWPLTADSGYLSCDNHKLYFTVIGGALNGKQYAMNGEAMNEHRFPKIDEIWKKGTNSPNVNITEVFERGLRLCK